MTERVTRGQLPENSSQKQEEEILDITELLEDLEELPEVDAAAGQEGEEAVSDAPGFQKEDDSTDLEAIFSELEDLSADDDEEIIDLVDLADEKPADEGVRAGTMEETATVEEAVLTDFSLDDFELETEAGEASEGEVDLEEDFISAFELDDVLQDAPPPPEGSGMDAELPDVTASADEDLFGTVDFDLLADVEEKAPLTEAQTLIGTAAAGPPVDEVSPGDEEGGVVSVSEAQIDAAVERVIRKMYAEKIDAVLVEAIEKTVSQEISRLKAILNLESSDR